MGLLTNLAAAVMADSLNELRVALIDHQRAIGIRDRGGSADSLRVIVASRDTSLAGQLYGFARWKQQNDGRGPNKSGKPSKEMVDAITDWAKRHGIETKAAYPIAVKIATQGTKVPNPHNPGGVFTDVINEDTVRRTISPRLRQAVLKGIKSTLFTNQ